MKSTVLAFAVAGLAAALPLAAVAQTVPAACPVEAENIVANDGLDRARAAVQAGRLTVLAMGSSSIEGIGASTRDLGFTPLLQQGLRERLPGVEVTVINKGIGGETAKETADRLDREIQAARPDLVLWQLGTNDVLRDRPLDDFFADFRRGQQTLNAAGVDVVLIDPQRLPDNAQNPAFRGRNPALSEIARLIDLEGGRVGYGVQRRFAAMTGWSGLDRGGVGPDDLHLNDPGYACWAANTAEGLATALR